MGTHRWGAGAALIGLAAAGSTLGAQQYVVKTWATPNPVPAGSCAGISVQLYDAMNQRVLQLPDGTPVHGGSWEYSTPPSPDFQWKYNDPSHGSLCARPGAGPATSVVTVTLKGQGVTGSTDLTIQPAQMPPDYATNPQPGVDPGRTAGEPAGYAPPGGMPERAGAGPTSAPSGSLLDRIKADADQRMAAQTRNIDSAIVGAAGDGVGAVSGAVGRGAVAVAGVAAGLAQGAVAEAEKALSSAFTGGDEKAISEQLAAGRAVLDIRFVGSSPELDPPSEKPLEALSRVLADVSGVFLIESHTDASGDPAADQRLSEVRASVVKARLVAAGVPAARLFAAGFGSSRPLTSSSGVQSGHTRIELSRVQ